MGARQRARAAFWSVLSFLSKPQRANMSVPCGRDSEPPPLPAPPACVSHHAVLHVVAALSCTSVYLWLHYRKLLSRFFAACPQEAASQLPFGRRPSSALKALALALAPAIYLAGSRINRKRGMQLAAALASAISVSIQ